MDRNLKNLIESPEFKQYHEAQQDPLFNVFDVLRNAEYEIRHSNVLAWLLDPGQNHGIGNKFLREFVQHLNEQANKQGIARIGDPSRLAMDKVTVERETLHVDILIEFSSARLLLAVENKTVDRMDEHYRQVKGYETKLGGKYREHEIRSVLLTTSDKGDAHEREVIHVSWMDIHRIVKSLHDHNTFGAAGDVPAFIRQYLDVIGRMVAQPGAGRDYLRTLLEEHKPVLVRLQQQGTAEASSLQSEIEQHWSRYTNTVEQLKREFRQKPAALRSAVREHLKRWHLDAKPRSRGSLFWLYWELGDVAKALNFDTCLVWALNFSNTEVTLKFYFPEWSNGARYVAVRRRIIEFLRTRPIDRSKLADKYRMKEDESRYFYVYENRLLDKNDLLGKTYEQSRKSICEKLDDVFAHGSDYERIETYLRCLAFSPRETVPHHSEGESEK